MERLSFDRRSFMKSALAAGAFAATAGRANLSAFTPAFAPAFGFEEEQPRRLPQVKVARDRVIRTVVGLRPYRAEGFVLAPERLGEKVVVHNYGHGGAGVTLSWGVATLAAEHARNVEGNAEVVKGFRR